MQTVEQLRAGIDWITMTLDKREPSAGMWFLEALSHLHLVEHEGYKATERRLMGYEGKGVGGCFVGEREGDYIAQFSGHYADDAFYVLQRTDAHVSRIDLRVDVKYHVMPHLVARKGFSGVLRANTKLPAQRQRKCYILMGNDGGHTLYVGSPTSEQRGRLYNKEIQSEDPQYRRTWRYECVFRNDSAGRVSALLRQAGRADFDTIRSIVATWYSDRGVSTKHFGPSAVVAVPLTRTLPTDVERRLEWLKKQVAPALRLLQEHGATNEMLEALGIVIPREDA